MKHVKHTRRGNTVIDLSTGAVEEHKSINQAKRRSRALQMESDHGLGRGSVRKLARKFKQRLKAWRHQ